MQLDDNINRLYIFLKAQDLEILLEISNFNALDKSTLKKLKNKYSEDKELLDNKILNFLVKGLELIQKIVLYISRRYKEVFSKVARKQRLYSYKFDKILVKLCNIF